MQIFQRIKYFDFGFDFDFLFFLFRFEKIGLKKKKKKEEMTHEMISKLLCEKEISINCIKVDLIMGQLLVWCPQNKIGSFLILYYLLKEGKKKRKSLGN